MLRCTNCNKSFYPKKLEHPDGAFRGFETTCPSCKKYSNVGYRFSKDHDYQHALVNEPTALIVENGSIRSDY